MADTVFLSLHNALGPFAFVIFAALAAAAGLYVAAVVPETRGGAGGAPCAAAQPPALQAGLSDAQPCGFLWPSPCRAGKTLQEIQALLALRCAPGSRGRPQPPRERQGLLPPGAVASDAG